MLVAVVVTVTWCALSSSRSSRNTLETKGASRSERDGDEPDRATACPDEPTPASAEPDPWDLRRASTLGGSIVRLALEVGAARRAGTCVFAPGCLRCGCLRFEYVMAGRRAVDAMVPRLAGLAGIWTRGERRCGCGMGAGDGDADADVDDMESRHSDEETRSGVLRRLDS